MFLNLVSVLSSQIVYQGNISQSGVSMVAHCDIAVPPILLFFHKVNHFSYSCHISVIRFKFKISGHNLEFSAWQLNLFEVFETNDRFMT